MPQILKSTGFEARMRELYEQAEIADKSLSVFMRQMNSLYPGEIMHPPLKLQKTAEEKLMRAEGGAPKTKPDDPSTLRDIARATIKYKRLETLYSARDYIKTQHKHAIDAEKDRYEGVGAISSGYRDVKFFLKVAAGKYGTHICELQLNIGSALVAKELEHPVYEILRRADSSPSVSIPGGEAQKLGPKLRAVFASTKRAGFLNQSELGALRDVVLLFFMDREASKLKPGGVNISMAQVHALESLTPKIFAHYEKQAMEAKYMTADGFKTSMTHQQYSRLT